MAPAANLMIYIFFLLTKTKFNAGFLELVSALE